MTTEVNTGDRVKVTIEGKVASEALSAHAFCRTVKDDSGTFHYVYLDGGGSAEVEVIKPAENFTTGRAYRSALNYVYLRTATGWMDEHGARKDDYPKRPMVPMVPEVKVTEDSLKSELRRVFRTSGDYQDRITDAAIPRLVSAVKNAGFQVGK